MEGNTGESDLRSSANAPHSVGIPSAPTPGAGWSQPQHTEVVEERNITWYRAIAKVVDYFVVSVATNFITGPIMLIWWLSNIDRFERLADESETSVFPEDFFVQMLIIWGVVFSLSFALTVAYYFILEKKFQQTLGKKAFDLKVIDMTNGRASTGQLLARAILYPISMMTYFWVVELIVALIREDGRSVTDLICGTTVIRLKKVYYQQGARPAL